MLMGILSNVSDSLRDVPHRTPADLCASRYDGTLFCPSSLLNSHEAVHARFATAQAMFTGQVEAFSAESRTPRPPRRTETGCSAVISSTRPGLRTDAPELPYGLDSTAKRYALGPCTLPQSVAALACIASSRRSRREMERELARTAPGQPRSLVSAQRTRVRCWISADANGRWVFMLRRDDARKAADLGGVGAARLRRRRVRWTMQPLLV